MRVAAATDNDQSPPGFRHVDPRHTGPTPSRSRQWRRGRGVRRGHLRLVVGLTLRARERHPLCRAAAVPAGSVRAASQVAWLDAVDAHPDFSGLRADAWTAVRAVAQSLAFHADWRTMLSRPTHAVLAERAGVSLRTVARVRARLQAAGLLGIVTPGATRDLVDPDAGALAQAYVLTVPKPDTVADSSDDASAIEQGVADCVDGSVIPSTPLILGRGELPRTREKSARSARGTNLIPNRSAHPGHLTLVPTPQTALDETRWPGSPLGSLDDSSNMRAQQMAERAARREAHIAELSAAVISRTPLWPAGRRPATRDERLAAAAEGRRIDPVLRRVSVAHVAALFRDWHLAGWTLADIRTALQTRPDGTPWPHTLADPAHDVRNVPGWVRHRLAAWRATAGDHASPPTLSPSQRAAAAAAVAAETHARTVAEHIATAAASVPAAAVEGWAQYRARLAARAGEARARRAEARHLPWTP